MESREIKGRLSRGVIILLLIVNSPRVVTPPHGCSSSHRTGADVTKSKIATQSQEVTTVQRLGEDISYVVLTTHSKNLDVAKRNVVTDSVKLDPDMFNFGM